jgi:hypothetical protein
MENDQKKYRCTTYKNQVRFTPPPKYRALIEALNGGDGSISETVTTIVKQYFDSMPTLQRQRLLSRGKNHY